MINDFLMGVSFIKFRWLCELVGVWAFQIVEIPDVFKLGFVQRSQILSISSFNILFLLLTMLMQVTVFVTIGITTLGTM